MNFQSLSVKTLLKMSMRISIIVVIVTGASYIHLLHTTEMQTKDTLLKYIHEREAREGISFDNARKNHQAMRDEFLKVYKEYLKNPRTPTLYQNLVRTYTDGVTRNRDEKFDGKILPGIFIGKQAVPNLKLMARILAAYDLTLRFGLGYHHFFQDTYFTFPENALVLYWPEEPLWALNAKPDLNLPEEEYANVSMPHNDPSRKTVWTGLFYDKVSKIWMVTSSTPIYDGDEFLGSVHHDLMVNELVDRTLNDHLTGANNFIVRSDGRLIAHLDHLEDIQKQNGLYDLNKSDDKVLLDQFKTIINLKDKEIGTDNNDNYLAVAKIDGPNWFLVTEYPKKLVRQSAMENAGFLLGAGLFSLIVEIIVLFFVLRREISQPLLSLTQTTDKIAQGNYNLQPVQERKDELGLLGKSISIMASAIQQRDKMLARHNEDLESLVEERTRELDEQKALNIQASKLSALGEMAGGIAHEINTPLATIKLLVTQTQQEVQGDIPDLENIQKNLGQVDKTIDRVAKIVRGLRSFARNGNVDPFENTSMNTVIEDAISLCHEQCKMHGIELKLNMPAQNSLVTCRSVEICQVLLNLISNAHDAVMKLENRWIELTLVETLENIEIRVKDSGSGIPAELREKIFNPFFTTKGIGQGTGMGLSISHGIIKAHKGRLYLDETSAYTCFVLELPKIQEQAA